MDSGTCLHPQGLLHDTRTLADVTGHYLVLVTCPHLPLVRRGLCNVMPDTADHDPKYCSMMILYWTCVTCMPRARLTGHGHEPFFSLLRDSCVPSPISRHPLEGASYGMSWCEKTKTGSP